MDLRNASLSVASISLCSVTLGSSPPTMTGFLLPISSTSGFSPAIRFSPLDQCGDRLFDETLEGGEQLAAERAVHHAMIAGQRDRQLADEFHSPVFGFDWCAARGADRQNGGVRRIDDGGELAHAVHAEIGNGAGAALVFVRLELCLLYTSPSPRDRTRSR